MSPEVVAGHDITQIWDEVMAAVRETGPRPDIERHLVNGHLLLTHPQYMEILNAEYDKPLFDVLHPTAGYERKPVSEDSVPVLVVTPTPVEVGDKMVFLFNDRIYVVDKADLQPPMPAQQTTSKRRDQQGLFEKVRPREFGSKP